MDRIRIDQVVTDRDLDAAEPLPSDPAIVNVPIVVSRDDLVLIDGLRRLKYLKDSGLKTAAVTYVSNVDEAFEVLAPQHAGRQLTPRQMWNILRIVYPWGLRKSNAIRSALGQATRRTGVSSATVVKGSHRTPLRVQMVEMLNASSGHVIERTIYLYRKADAGEPLAVQMAAEVDEGKRGIYSAADAVSKGTLMPGNIQDRNEQITLLDNGSRNLGAQVGALLKLGSPVLVNSEDLETYIQALAVSRGKLSTFINQLKAVQRERTHG